MTDQIPPMRFSPEATPWARTIQQRLLLLEGSAQQAALSALHTNKAQNAALGALAGQIKALNQTVSDLSATTAQLNAASSSASATEGYSVGGTPEAQSAYTNRDAAVVTFTRPSWAKGATVLVNGRIIAWGTQNSASNFTALAMQVAGTLSADYSANIQAPAHGRVFNAGTDTGQDVYMDSVSALSIPFARTFAVTDPTISCALRFTKGFTGVGHAFSVDVGATVFWSAN